MKLKCKSINKRIVRPNPLRLFFASSFVASKQLEKNLRTREKYRRNAIRQESISFQTINYVWLTSPPIVRSEVISNIFDDLLFGRRNILVRNFRKWIRRDFRRHRMSVFIKLSIYSIHRSIWKRPLKIKILIFHQKINYLLNWYWYGSRFNWFGIDFNVNRK